MLGASTSGVQVFRASRPPSTRSAELSALACPEERNRLALSPFLADQEQLFKIKGQFNSLALSHGSTAAQSEIAKAVVEILKSPFARVKTESGTTTFAEYRYRQLIGEKNLKEDTKNGTLPSPQTIVRGLLLSGLVDQALLTSLLQKSTAALSDGLKEITDRQLRNFYNRKITDKFDRIKHWTEALTEIGACERLAPGEVRKALFVAAGLSDIADKNRQVYRNLLRSANSETAPQENLDEDAPRVFGVRTDDKKLVFMIDRRAALESCRLTDTKFDRFDEILNDDPRFVTVDFSHPFPRLILEADDFNWAASTKYFSRPVQGVSAITAQDIDPKSVLGPLQGKLITAISGTSPSDPESLPMKDPVRYEEGRTLYESVFATYPIPGRTQIETALTRLEKEAGDPTAQGYSVKISNDYIRLAVSSGAALKERLKMEFFADSQNPDNASASPLATATWEHFRIGSGFANYLQSSKLFNSSDFHRPAGIPPETAALVRQLGLKVSPNDSLHECLLKVTRHFVADQPLAALIRSQKANIEEKYFKGRVHRTGSTRRGSVFELAYPQRRVLHPATGSLKKRNSLEDLTFAISKTTDPKALRDLFALGRVVLALGWNRVSTNDVRKLITAGESRRALLEANAPHVCEDLSRMRRSGLLVLAREHPGIPCDIAARGGVEDHPRNQHLDGAVPTLASLAAAQPTTQSNTQDKAEAAQRASGLLQDKWEQARAVTIFRSSLAMLLKSSGTWLEGDWVTTKPKVRQSTGQNDPYTAVYPGEGREGLREMPAWMRIQFLKQVFRGFVAVRTSVATPNGTAADLGASLNDLRKFCLVTALKNPDLRVKTAALKAVAQLNETAEMLRDPDTKKGMLGFPADNFDPIPQHLPSRPLEVRKPPLDYMETLPGSLRRQLTDLAKNPKAYGIYTADDLTHFKQYANWALDWLRGRKLSNSSGNQTAAA